MAIASEFKKFVARGNVIDMAVGIIMGAAFTSIVRSLVDDVIMPVVGVLTGNVDFKSKFINLGPVDYETLQAARDAGAPTLNYGMFVNATVTFCIVAIVVFMMVKVINELKERALTEEKEEVKKEVKKDPPPDIQLLTEIRDLLKRKK